MREAVDLGSARFAALIAPVIDRVVMGVAREAGVRSHDVPARVGTTADAANMHGTLHFALLSRVSLFPDSMLPFGITWRRSGEGTWPSWSRRGWCR